MSIHRSLAGAGKLKRHRNVLTRPERIERLKKEDRWSDSASVFGLAKVRNIMMRAKKKVKEEAKDEDGVATAEAPAADGAAAPAAKKEEKKK